MTDPWGPQPHPNDPAGPGFRPPTGVSRGDSVATPWPAAPYTAERQSGLTAAGLNEPPRLSPVVSYVAPRPAGVSGRRDLLAGDLRCVRGAPGSPATAQP